MTMQKHVSRTLIACAVFLMIGIAWLIYWLAWGRYFESTTDAYVNGNMISLNSQITGNVNGIYADDTQFVAQGQLLVTLDETDALVSLEMAKDNLASTVRNVVSLFAQTKEVEAQIVAKQADYLVAVEDYERRQNLIDEGGVSTEDLQTSEAKMISAEEELNVMEYRHEALLAEVQNTTVQDHPRVQQAKDDVNAAYLTLKRCKIKSPANGLIAQRSAQVGMRVKPETPLLAVIPLDQMWVDANYKEVQLKKMRIGQAVRLKSDMYGRDVIFEGKIIGIGGGTGSVFSILPPQNATGNWIKIVQRLPVRIGLNADQLKNHPLRLGLSMDVRVDLRNQTLPLIPKTIIEAIQYKTTIFDDQEDGVDELIEKILEKNLCT